MKAEWMHVDINAYFATMLQQENPTLRYRPVGVVKERGRQCMIAASKEAKKRGIKTGCSAREAKELAPDIVFVPAHFNMCLDATKKLRKIFQEFVPTVELFSLDEAFLYLGDCQRLHPDAYKLGEQIQSTIKNVLGEWVTCNVGISENRFLAKMTSEVSPKGSVSVVDETNKDALLASTTFESVCGIGFRLGARLEALGVTTPWGINLMSDEELESQFGPYWSVELRRMGQGLEPSFLEKHDARATQTMKSVGRSITGWHLVKNENDVRRVLRNLIEEATYKARKMQLAGREVWVALYGHDQYWSDHKTLKRFINQPGEMFELVDEMVESRTNRFPVIKFAIRLSGLQPIDTLPRSFFPDWQKREQLTQACDEVTRKYGLFTVRPGSLLDPKVIIRPEVTGWLGDQQFQFLQD